MDCFDYFFGFICLYAYMLICFFVFRFSVKSLLTFVYMAIYILAYEAGMMNDSENKNIWHVESLRATVFPSVPSTVELSGKLIPEPPDLSFSRPKERFHRNEWTFDKGKLVLNVHQERTDWIYSAQDKDDAGLPIIAKFDEIGDRFYLLVKEWLKICDHVTRLAFGAVLLQPVENHIEGYKKIEKYLPYVKLFPDTSSDFLYQINRPRLSNSVKRLPINRLSKWSVAKLRNIHLHFSSDDKSPPAVLPDKELTACRLELDINTSQQHSGEFSKDDLLIIFEELVSMAEELSIDGDKNDKS